MSLAGRAAIVGIGHTEFSKESGRTEMRLAVEAVVRRARRRRTESEGRRRFLDVHDGLQRGDRARAQPGLRRHQLLTAASITAAAPRARSIHQAAMAVATGAANAVVAYRALNGRSWRRFGPSIHGQADRDHPLQLVHAVRPDHAGRWVAMFAQRYMHDLRRDERGPRSRRGRACRAFAATNPGRMLPREADHPRGPPSDPLDRRAPPPPRLLPGVRRRRRRRSDERWSGRATSASRPRSSSAAAQGSRRRTRRR